MKKIMIIVGMVAAGLSALIALIETVPPGSSVLVESSWELRQRHLSSFTYKNARISVVTLGKGEPLVLLHGGGSWSYTFRNNILPLSRHFTVYAPDMPGHGYSGIPDGFDYTLESVSEVIQAMFEHYGIARAHVAGNSWGGGWAVHFAQNNPGKVGVLVLINAVGPADSGERDGSLWKYLTVPVLGKIIPHFVTRGSVRDGYVADLFYDPTLVTEEMVAETFGPLHYEKNLTAQAKYQAGLDWRITGKRLSELKNVIVIWGRHDSYLPLSLAEEFAAAIPGTKVYVVEKARHLPHEERYAQVNDIIIRELDE